MKVYTVDRKSFARKEILNVKFYYFFSLRISWIWLFRENGRFLSSRNLFLTRNFTFEYLLTLLRLGVEKKEIHSYSLCVYIYTSLRGWWSVKKRQFLYNEKRELRDVCLKSEYRIQLVFFNFTIVSSYQASKRRFSSS